MKITYSILWATGIVLSLALSLQAHTFGWFTTTDLPKIYNAIANYLTEGQNFLDEDNSFPIVEKSIALNTGIRMKYLEMGNPQGRTLLFIHGYTDTSRSFENLMEELIESDPNLRLIAPDLRGHGGSSLPAFTSNNSFRMEDFAMDILNFMELKKLSKVDLVGHSMGTVIAQEIALQHPDKIASLTMIGAFVNGKKNSAIQDFLIPELLGKWKQNLTERFGQDWKSKSYTMTPEDLGSETTEFLRENWVTDADTKGWLLEEIYLETIAVPLATWFGALEALSEVDNSDSMKYLKSPTLIIWGTGDDLVLKSDQNRLLNACQVANHRNATPIHYKSYNGNGTSTKKPGHNLHWGNARRVAADIMEFINLEKISGRK